MTKEKRTFAWDTVVTFTEDGRTFYNVLCAECVTEVKWCPVTEMYWEVQRILRECPVWSFVDAQYGWWTDTLSFIEESLDE